MRAHLVHCLRGVSAERERPGHADPPPPRSAKHRECTPFRQLHREARSSAHAERRVDRNVRPPEPLQHRPHQTKDRGGRHPQPFQRPEFVRVGVVDSEVGREQARVGDGRVALVGKQ